jgi:hypothetical protein
MQKNVTRLQITEREGLAMEIKTAIVGMKISGNEALGCALLRDEEKNM